MAIDSSRSSANPPRPLPRTTATRACSVVRARTVRAACSARAYRFEVADLSSMCSSLAKVGKQVPPPSIASHIRCIFHSQARPGSLTLLLIWSSESSRSPRGANKSGQNNDCKQVRYHLDKLNGNFVSGWQFYYPLYLY